MRNNLAGDVAAGVGAGLACLPVVVAVGFIALGAFGPATAATMSVVVFATNLLASALRRHTRPGGW